MDWKRKVLGTTAELIKLYSRSLNNRRGRERIRYNSKVRPVFYAEGDLVLLKNPKRATKMGQHCTGPYLVVHVVPPVDGPAPHAVSLKDVATGHVVKNKYGQVDTFTTERLVRFGYPREMLKEYDAQKVAAMLASVWDAEDGGLIAYMVPTSEQGYLTVGRLQNWQEDEPDSAEILRYRLAVRGPTPWPELRWSPTQPAVYETVKRSEVFGKVSFTAEGVLMPESVVGLGAFGLLEETPVRLSDR
jgi:hypothetical protein